MADPITNLPGEIWKPVVGWGTDYYVSNMGRVRSADRVRRHRWPGSTRVLKAKLLVPTAKPSGYLSVMLGKFTRRHVHLLVLEAFVCTRPPGLVCCHNDGNPANNRLDNLRWDTCHANMQDAIQHGTMPRGERCTQAKLTNQQAREAREYYAAHPRTPHSVVAEMYGIGQTCMSNVLSGKSYVDAGGPVVAKCRRVSKRRADFEARMAEKAGR